MKKPLLLLLILNVAVLNLFAKPSKKTLVEQGLYLASLMKEKASCDSYFAEASLKDDDDLFATLSEFSSDDVSKPTAVYKISGNFTEFMQGIQATPDTKAFSPVLRKEFELSMLSGFPALWNFSATNSVSCVAAASVISSHKVFVSKEISESCIYVFTFEDAYPVAVTFECGEDNAVFATATFVLDRHFPKSLEDMFPEIGRRLNVKKISY